MANLTRIICILQKMNGMGDSPHIRFLERIVLIDILQSEKPDGENILNIAESNHAQIRMAVNEKLCLHNKKEILTLSEANTLWLNKVDSTVQTVGNHLDRRKLTGHYQDDELVIDNEGDENDASLVYMKARYYDTQIGRFYSADPIGATGEKGSANQDYAFSYVGNNPIIRIDPLGLWYIDLNIAFPIAVWGPTFGAILEFPEGKDFRVYGYGGVGVITPGGGASLTISPNDVAKWNAGLQVQFIGAAQVGVDAEAFADFHERHLPWDEPVPTLWEDAKSLYHTGFFEGGLGGTIPLNWGGSLTGFRTFLIYDENFPEDDRWRYEDSWEELEKELEP